MFNVGCDLNTKGGAGQPTSYKGDASAMLTTTETKGGWVKKYPPYTPGSRGPPPGLAS